MGILFSVDASAMGCLYLLYVVNSVFLNASIVTSSNRTEHPLLRLWCRFSVPCAPHIEVTCLNSSIVIITQFLRCLASPLISISLLYEFLILIIHVRLILKAQGFLVFSHWEEPTIYNLARQQLFFFVLFLAILNC